MTKADREHQDTMITLFDFPCELGGRATLRIHKDYTKKELQEVIRQLKKIVPEMVTVYKPQSKKVAWRGW